MAFVSLISYFSYSALYHLYVFLRPCRHAGQSGVKKNYKKWDVRRPKKITKKRRTCPALSGVFKKKTYLLYT